MTTSTTQNQRPRPCVSDIEDAAEQTPNNDRVRGAQMHPMLGREVVEREQHVEIVTDLGGGVGPLRPVLVGKRLRGFIACCLFSALWISASAFFAPEWADFGSAARTLPILCHQHRCSLVPGNTSRTGFQNPKAPSPIASTG